MGRRLLVVVSVLALAVGLIGTSSVLADEEPSFPESHMAFLGSASYAAMTAEQAEPATRHAVLAAKPLSVGANVQMNAAQLFFPNGAIGRSETTITGFPNKKNLVAGWNDADGFCGPPFNVGCTPPPVPGLSGYAYSTDGGSTWTDGGAPPTGTAFFGPGTAGQSASGVYVTLGDPSMDAGKKDVYYANLGQWTDSTGVPAGVTVHTGAFKGKSFSWNSEVLLQSPNYPNDFLDKEHIAIDDGGKYDKIYVTVTNFIEVGGMPFFGFGRIEAYSSLDGGATWSRSIVQPDETISVPLNQGVINQGSEPAVAHDGTVYTAWERGWLFPFFGGAAAPEIRVATSFDNGATWGPVGPPNGTVVSQICSSALFPPAGYNRSSINDFPRIAVADTGQHLGRVYVTYQDCSIANGGPQASTGGIGHPDADVYVSYSDDQGATWSTPTLVAGGGDGLVQFWPDVSVQANGTVNVIYWESTSTGTCLVPNLVDLKWAQSTDGGASFGAPVTVSSVPTDWCATFSNITPNFGDYNTAVSIENELFATWADGRNGIPDAFFARGK